MITARLQLVIYLEMYLEYIVGPIAALLFGMKFTDFKIKEKDQKIKELEEKIELIQEHEKELPKRIMATVLPVAQAVNKLNQQVGL